MRIFCAENNTILYNTLLALKIFPALKQICDDYRAFHNCKLLFQIEKKKGKERNERKNQ